jgi:hypothetical protein
MLTSSRFASSVLDGYAADNPPVQYVDWFNHRRLYEACGDVPPAGLSTK